MRKLHMVGGNRYTLVPSIRFFQLDVVVIIDGVLIYRSDQKFVFIDCIPMTVIRGPSPTRGRATAPLRSRPQPTRNRAAIATPSLPGQRPHTQPHLCHFTQVATSKIADLAAAYSPLSSLPSRHAFM